MNESVHKNHDISERVGKQDEQSATRFFTPGWYPIENAYYRRDNAHLANLPEGQDTIFFLSFRQYTDVDWFYHKKFVTLLFVL